MPCLARVANYERTTTEKRSPRSRRCCTTDAHPELYEASLTRTSNSPSKNVMASDHSHLLFGHAVPAFEGSHLHLEILNSESVSGCFTRRLL